MSIRQSKTFTLDRITRGVIGIAVVVMIFILINRLSSVLLPFVVGLFLAYLINPIVCFIQYKMRVKNRVISIIIAFIAVVGVLWGLILVLVPAIGIEGARVSSLISQMSTQWAQHPILPKAWQDWIVLQIDQIDFKEVLSGESFRQALQKAVPQFMNVLSGTWTFVTQIFVIFVVLMYLFFILMDYENVTEGIAEIIPEKYREAVMGIGHDLNDGMENYFRGQFTVAAIVGLLFALGFKIIGLPLGITIGLAIGVLNIVPYMQTFGIIPVVFLAYLKTFETGHTLLMQLLGPLIVFAIVQLTQDMFLVPKIMGKRMGLNPAVILLSLSIWGALLGVIGMIIALPITTLIISYYRRFVIRGESFLNPVKVNPGTHFDVSERGRDKDYIDAKKQERKANALEDQGTQPDQKVKTPD